MLMASGTAAIHASQLRTGSGMRGQAAQNLARPG
jgi:hypothetical protein